MLSLLAILRSPTENGADGSRLRSELRALALPMETHTRAVEMIMERKKAGLQLIAVDVLSIYRATRIAREEVVEVGAEEIDGAGAAVDAARERPDVDVRSREEVGEGLFVPVDQDVDDGAGAEGDLAGGGSGGRHSSIGGEVVRG